jgi:uncharacterized membrane protein YidH (DUF202 family)
MTAVPGRPGLQPERTALAWQRTAITATVVMVPLVVVNARLGLWLMTMLGSMATLAAGVLVVGVRRRFRQLMSQDGPLSPFEPMLRVAAVTGLAAFLALVTALVLVLS